MFAGGSFGIGGQLVVFSNISPRVVAVGGGASFDVPEDITAASLWKGIKSHERMELELHSTARVRVSHFVSVDAPLLCSQRSVVFGTVCRAS